MCVTTSTLPPGSDKRDSRAERRQRTEGAILEAARDLFAHLGFEKTTIRGVASAAGVDPALVMQYFGNKDGLFAAAARWAPEQETLLQADLASAPESWDVTVADPAIGDGVLYVPVGGSLVAYG